MKKIVILFLLCFISFWGIAQNTVNSSPLNVGEKLSFYSSILNEERTLNIYVLPQYIAVDERDFGVIYLLDGSIYEDFMHVVGLCQFMHMMYTMPPFIIVGITNVDRRRDFTFPTTVKEQKDKYPTTGGSANFIEFLEKEVQPLISKKYNTGAGQRFVIGQSLGGLLATEILLKKPHLFTHYLITSPSLWWDHESLLDQNMPVKIPDSTKVFISVGKEGNVMVKDAKKLHALLRKYNKNASIYFNYLPKENHATILHNSLYGSFLRLYKERY